MFLSKKFFCPFQKGLYIRPRAAAIERIGLILDDSLNPISGRGIIPTKNLTYLVTDAISSAGIRRIWSQTPFPRRELDVFGHRHHFLGGNSTYLVTDTVSSAGIGRIWSQTSFPRRELDVFGHRRRFLGGNWTYLVTDAISSAGIGRIWSQTPFPRRELDVFSHRRHFLGGNWTYLVTDAISSAGMRYIRVNDKHFLPLCVSTRQASTETRQGKEERNLLYRPRGKGWKVSADAPPPASRIRPCARIASINKLFN